MITFPDVSGYQAGLSLAGATATIAKATEGGSFVDHAYPGFHGQAQGMGIPFTGYHFLLHGDIGGQVDHALSIVGPTVPLMLDVETAVDGGQATFADTLNFIDGYRARGGLTTRGVALISSTYLPLTADGPGWQPYGGVTPTIWQYTSSQPFNGMAVDFNAYKGTVEQLRTLFNGQPTTQEDGMQTLVQQKGKPAVYVADGIHLRWLQTEATLVGFKWQVDAGFLGPLSNGGQIQVVDNLDAFGTLVGPSPDGTPPPDGTPIDLDALAAKVAKATLDGASARLAE